MTWWLSLFTSFDPQLKVVPVEGKTGACLMTLYLTADTHVAYRWMWLLKPWKIRRLAIYDGQQAMVRIKGVDDNFAELSHIN